MPQNMQSMLNFVLGIKQLHQQQDEQAFKERTSTGSAVQSYIQDLSHVKSPAGLVALKKHYNENFHIAGATLDELGTQYAKTPEEMRRDLTAEGLDRARQGTSAPQISPELAQLIGATTTQQMTGSLPGTVAQSGAQAGMINGAANAPGGFDSAMKQGFLNQLLRGQTTQQAAVSDAGAALPAADKTRAARIGMDLEAGAGNKLSASTQIRGQDLSNAQAMAQIGQAHAAMVQQYGLETANLAIQRTVAEAQARKGSELTPAERLEAVKAAAVLAAHPPTTEGGAQVAPVLMNQLLNMGIPNNTNKVGPNLSNLWGPGK